MVKDLRRQGFKLITITDLHIAKVPGSKPYDEGMAHDYFVKKPDGSVYVGQVWPGDAVFPDLRGQRCASGGARCTRTL